MATENEKLFWKKKEFISFVLSILVFFIHSFFAQDMGDNSLISVVNYRVSFFFSRSITQFAVPMFFMLSALTFYKGYDNKKYLKKIKSRIFTLVIPYLLWNTIWMLWEFLKSGLFPKISDILKGVFFYSFNQPFWFMFNLIIYSFASPIIFLIIRNKYVGISSIIALTLLSLFGIHLPENIFYYPTSVIFYLIGALIGYHYFDFACKRPSKITKIISVLFLSTYVVLKNAVPQKFFIENNLIQIVVFTLCAFSLWNVIDIFIEKIKPRAIFRRSFAIYAMHLNLAIIILKALSLCLPETPYLKIPEFIIMVVLTLVIINLFCTFLEKFLPKVYGILFGNRKAK